MLNSLTGKESFDAIETTDKIGLQYSYAKTSSSFHVVATIPLALLGWTPKSGSTVKMDLGLYFRQRKRHAHHGAHLLDEQQLFRQRHQ